MPRAASRVVKALVRGALEGLAAGALVSTSSLALAARPVGRDLPLDQREVGRALLELRAEGVAFSVGAGRAAKHGRSSPANPPRLPPQSPPISPDSPRKTKPPASRESKEERQSGSLNGTERSEAAAAAAATRSPDSESLPGNGLVATLATKLVAVAEILAQAARELVALASLFAREGRVSPQNEGANQGSSRDRDVKPEKFHRELSSEERELVRNERVAEEREKGEHRPEHLERVADLAVEDCRTIPDRFERYQRSAKRRADVAAEKKAREVRWAAEREARDKAERERADKDRRAFGEALAAQRAAQAQLEADELKKRLAESSGIARAAAELRAMKEGVR